MKKKIRKEKEEGEGEGEGENDHGGLSESKWTGLCLSFAYTEAKVEQEEDVESHVDLQSEVLVEVLTGLDWTVKGRDTGKRTVKIQKSGGSKLMTANFCQRHFVYFNLTKTDSG